jgi:predicted phage baseplate assembly protein
MNGTSNVLNTCGCCEGVEQLTPATIINRPGLNALAYRVGIQATFLETMLARLSNMGIPLGELDTVLNDPDKAAQLIYPLLGLTTRSKDDPAIALIDAWAVIADVLSFYQERIANEGYLRTATERRSVLELAKLVGYTLRPGVAASVFLAYILESGQSTTIALGNRVQSLPGPGQMPQYFETSFDIDARAEWNAISPRMSIPQYIGQIVDPNAQPSQISTSSLYISTADSALYLAGTSTNLKPRDPLLFVFNDAAQGQVYGHVQSIDPHAADKYTRILFPAAFTPYAFFRNLESVMESYQNVETFGVTLNDPLVQSTVANLQSLNTGLQAAELLGFNTFLPPPVGGEAFRAASGQATAQAQGTTPTTLLDIHDFLLALYTLYNTAVTSGTTPGTYIKGGPLTEMFYLSLSSAAIASIERASHDGLLDEANTLFGTTGTTLDDLVTQLNASIMTSQTPPVRFATWVGGIVADTLAVVNSVPLFQSGVADIPVPIVTTSLAALLTPLSKAPSLQPPNGIRLARNTSLVLSRKSDLAPQLIQSLNQAAGSQIYGALSQAAVTAPPSLPTIYALRAKAAPFGSSAPKPATTTESQTTDKNNKTENVFTTGTSATDWSWSSTGTPPYNVLDLDAQYDKIVPESWIVVEYAAANNTSDTTVQIFQVDRVETVSRADYGIAAKVTRLHLKVGSGQSWLPNSASDLSSIRGITIYAQSEELTPANEPITDDIKTDASDPTIELDNLYDGLKSGRWLVVSGERTDIANTNGVKTSELVMLESVTQGVRILQRVPPSNTTSTESDIDWPGDTTHTFLHLATPLAYTYKRDTVTVGANVVKATHGQTRNEVLGSGDGSKSLQQFTLKQSPLTYVSAATASGAESTLLVRVNDLLWHETDDLDLQGPKDRIYLTQTDDQDNTTVIFGTGVHGARPTTGTENIKAVYRSGIGQAGNVAAGQISLLSTRPLGVKGVINPKEASGGADRENRDQARRNVPLAIMALDRIVSVQDYADFARTYAGIVKATSQLLSDGSQQLVYLTVAGQNNIPIDPTSDLYQNLFLSLRTVGNPGEPIKLSVCEAKLLVISARVRIQTDYQLETVVPNIRTAMLNAFGFDQRDLGQPVYQSEVLSVVQQVPGVAYVDLDILDAVDQAQLISALDTIHQQELLAANQGQTPNETLDLISLLGLKVRKVVPAHLAQPRRNAPGVFDPAQLAFLSADIPDTLIINELTNPHAALLSTASGSQSAQMKSRRNRTPRMRI